MDREGRRPSRRQWDYEYDDPGDTGYRSGSDKMERVLLQLVLIGLVALVSVQVLHANRHLAQILVSLDGLEGVDWSAMEVQPRSDQPAVAERSVPATTNRHVRPTVTVVLVTRRSEPAAVLLINGTPAGDFGKGSVTASVEPGHEIAVDGSAIQGRLRFRVIAAPGLVEPAWGREVETEGSRQVLGIARRGR